MTNLTERPAPLRAPVSAYDPNMESFTEQLHTQVKHELSSLGKVYDITGSLLHTRRHGMIVENVKAYIDNPIIRIPVVIDVSWDEREEAVAYYTATGRRFHPRSTGYGEDILNERERELLRATVKKSLDHPYWETRRRVFEHNNAPDYDPLPAVVVPGVASTALSGGAMILSSFDGLVFLSVPIAMGLGALWANRKNGQEKKEPEGIRVRHEKEVEAWNKDLHRTLMNLLDSTEDQSVFMDALLTLCDHYGVEYRGKLGLSKVNNVGEDLMEDVDRLKTEPHYGMAGSLRRVAVLFQGKLSADGPVEVIVFDGTHLYETQSGNESEGRVATISPL